MRASASDFKPSASLSECTAGDTTRGSLTAGAFFSVTRYNDDVDVVTKHIATGRTVRSTNEESRCGRRFRCTARVLCANLDEIVGLSLVVNSKRLHS